MVCLRVHFGEPLGTGVAVDGTAGSTTSGYWMCTDCWRQNNDHEWCCFVCGAGRPEDDS